MLRWGASLGAAIIAPFTVTYLADEISAYNDSINQNIPDDLTLKYVAVISSI